MNIRPVGTDLLHAGVRTEGHDEPNIRFSQFCENTLKISPKFFED